MINNRLNKDIRDYIVSEAVKKAGIPEAFDEIKKRRAKWADDVRIHALGGKEKAKKAESIKKRFEKTAAEFPKGLIDGPFRTGYDIAVNIAGKYFRVGFCGSVGSIPHQGRVYKITLSETVLKADHQLASEFDDIERDNLSIEEKRDDIRVKVRAAVDSLTTVKKLLEIWPEVSELLPKESKPAAKLPMVPVSELNAEIGLPSEVTL